MSERYTTHPFTHRILGPSTEIYDNLHQRQVSIYNGPYCEVRAEQRAREMNRAEDEKQDRN